MSYCEFTLETVERHLGVLTQEADLFPDAPTTLVPVWLPGCVTTGETWQFLRLADQVALLNRSRYYLDNVSGILGVLKTICREAIETSNHKRGQS